MFFVAKHHQMMSCSNQIVVFLFGFRDVHSAASSFLDAEAFDGLIKGFGENLREAIVE
jgi:hypothetical protein